ncbi:MAG: RNA methyltransferase [Myxococcales bacterium]|nr:TrmH family RNA methyltransferase [Myxococcales bacterium]
MRSRWGRWHGYMEELEEAMRIAGQHLGEVEKLLAHAYERKAWKGAKRDSADKEIIRRAVDIPFFRELIEIANQLDSVEDIKNAGFIGREWRGGEEKDEKLSVDRGVKIKPQPDDESPPNTEGPSPEAPPARIVAAERALQDRTRSLVVVLDNLVNSRNVSAVARSIEALGLQELHVIHAAGPPAMERTLTTRSERWLDIITHRDGVAAIDALRKRGYKILAADFGDGAAEVEAVPIHNKTAIVFGSEQLGVSEAVRNAADGLFFLPNSGFTAYINVSVATAISVYALDRRMRADNLRETLSEDEKAVLRPAWYTMLARGDKVKEAEYISWASHPPAIAMADEPRAEVDVA